MKRANIYKKPLLVAALISTFFALGVRHTHAQTLCIQPGDDQITGVEDGFRYELWSQNSQGEACMTLGEGALFSGEWDGILNYLARRGLGYNQTQEHQEIGRFYTTYNCDYNPSSASGNSYLSVYGWTVDPLVEYYIIEDWRNWIPSMAGGATSKGSFTINGSVYDIYENTRVNQPSIVGNATFQQYFSIRRDERNAGTINISDHFDKWESLGMDLGKLHEVSFVVEGYQSNGSFAFTELDVYVSDDPVLNVGDTKIPTPFKISSPHSGEVAIQFDEAATNASVKIYDPTGKVVFSQENFRNNLIQISNLKRGVYIVGVANNRNNYKSKILVY